MLRAIFEHSTELGNYLKNSAESDIAKYIKATEEMSGTLGELDLSLITSNDAMKGYLGTIEEGAMPSMNGFKAYCKENGLALKEMTLAENAAAIGAKALSVAMNALIGFAITQVISGIYKLTQASKQIREEAKAAGQQISSSISEIEDYKKKIKDLQDEINDSSSSIKETTNARKELLEIQDKLIEKYGKEAENISAITEAINSQSKALDKLSKKKYQETVNDFNNVTWDEALSLELEGYSDKMEKMITEVELPNQITAETIDEKHFFESIQSLGKYDNSYPYTDTLTLDGSLKERYETLLKIQELSKEYYLGNEKERKSFDDQITREINEVKSLRDEYEELYNKHILYDKILDYSGEQKGYDKIFNNINKAYDKVRDAQESGVEKDIVSAQDEYAELLSSLPEKIDDDSVISYFENMYPELQEVVGSWKFKLDFEENKDEVKNNIINTLDSFTKKGYTVESLQSFNPKADYNLVDDYNTLNSIAQKYMTIDQFVELLHEQGMLQNDAEKKLSDLFGKENIDKLTDTQISLVSDQDLSAIKTFEQLLELIKELESAKLEDSLLSFSKAWKELDSADDTKEAKENLLSLAEAGQLTVDAFKDSSIATDFMKATGLSAEQATQKINKLIEDVKQLNAMRTGITAITSAYDEKKDSKQKTVSASTLDSMATTLGVGDWDKKDKKVWQEYKDTAGNSAASLKDLKVTQDELATSFVNSNNFLTNLNDANKDYYTTLLTEMGVVNSSAVVEKGLRVQRANLALSTYESAKSEKERKTALDGLKKNLQNCTKEEKEFYFAKLLSNGENLDTTQECNELMLLGQELKIESSLLDSLKAKILDMNNVHARSTVTLETIEVHRVITNNTASSNAINGANATTDRNKQGSNSFGYNASAGLNSKTKSKTQIKAEQEAKELQNRIKLGIQTSKGNKSNNSSGSGSGKNKGSGSGSGNKTTWSAWGTEIDWIAKKIDVLNNKISLLDATYQNLPVASIDQIKKANKTLTDEIKTYSKLISTYGTAEKKYNKKAEKTLTSYRYEKQSKTVGKGKNKKTVVKNKKVANSKLSKKQITEVRKRVNEGKLSSKTSINQLIKTYGSEKAETIQQYLNYLEQANSAAQNKQSAIASRREKQIQKKQNYADYYQSQSDLADLRASDTSDTVKNRNKYLDNEINSQKKYYENLIAIAKLEKDSTEQARLQEEWQQKKIELQKQQLQNLVDEQEALANLYSAQAGQNANYTSSASGTYKNQNKYIEKQKEAVRKSYEYQIRIAKLDNNETEQARLKLELERQLVDLTQQEIDNIKNAYQNRIGYIDNANSDLDNAINLLSARGATVGSAYYNGKSTADQAQLKLVQEERTALQSQLANVTKYSNEWYSLQEDIQSLDDTESNLKVDIANNNTAVRDLTKAISDAVIAMDDNVKSEAQFVAGLLDNKESFEKASITNEGLAKLGVYGFSAEADEASINQIRRDRNAVQNAKVGSTVKVNGVDITFDSQEQIKEALNELIKQEQEYTSSLYDDYQGIIDFVKEYYESQLSYMKELIDAKKSLIEEEKEQYEYEKTVAEKTKSIATLQKQLAALQGDNSEEGRARRSALQVSLDEANQDLQDTEYDKYLSNQEQMLDSLYSEYESMLQALMKDSDAMLREGMDLINDNAATIVSVLGDTSDNWGYDYSEQFSTITNAILGEGGSGNIITKIGDTASTVDTAISNLGETIKKQFSNSEETALTTTNSILGKIEGVVNAISGKVGNNANNTNSEDKSKTNSTTDSTSTATYAQQAAKIASESKSTGADGLNWKEAKVYADEAKDYAKSQLSSARSFIGANATKAKKKKSEYSYVNQKIYAATGGKILSSDNLKKLAKNLGVTYNNAKQTGNLAKKLKAIGYTGFQTGGIIRATGVPLNGDNIPVRVNPNETILTQKFTDILPQTVEKMDTFNRLLTMNPDKYSSVSSGNTIGDVIINADMSGVENPYDFVRELQTNQKVQKAVTVAVNDLMTKGKITKNVQKVR